MRRSSRNARRAFTPWGWSTTGSTARAISRRSTSPRTSAHLRELTALIVRGQSQSPERIRMVVESEPVEVNLDTAIPLGLVTAELITNAYKHAFRDRTEGTITVRLARNGEQAWMLSVEDDGVGLPAGFEPEKARSLGLRLIRALSGQLRAEFSIASLPSGTRVRLVFPI